MWLIFSFVPRILKICRNVKFVERHNGVALFIIYVTLKTTKIRDTINNQNVLKTFFDKKLVNIKWIRNFAVTDEQTGETDLSVSVMWYQGVSTFYDK